MPMKPARELYLACFPTSAQTFSLGTSSSTHPRIEGQPLREVRRARNVTAALLRDLPSGRSSLD